MNWSPGHSIVPLLENQVPLASEVLGRAFQKDSLASYMIPDPDHRTKLLPFHFEVLVKYGLLAERVWTTTDLDGVIVCQPPGHAQMDEESVARSGLNAEGNIVGREAVDRFEAVVRYMEPLRLRDAEKRHWYVMVIGVDPSKKGQGIGSALLKHVSGLADLDQVPCYLETGQAENVSFYEKNGFRVIVEGVEPTSGLKFWTFRREPVPR